jgi:isopenicillin N synthase-like dioxygenase
MSIHIPRVDLRHFSEGSDNEKHQFIQTVGDALKDIGFLTVGGHTLDSETTKKAYEVFEKFFALPVEIKKKYDCVPGGARGYTPFGREHAKDQKLPDLKEFWHVGQDLPEDHPFKADYPDNVWPEEVPEMREIILAMYRKFEAAAEILLKSIALYFDLPETTFSTMMKDGNSVYRIIHYPPLDEAMPKGAVRAAAHEDINLITLLIESRGGGLELQTNDDAWHAVNALQGDIIADSGDMLSRVTNGVIPATTHRVVNPGETENTSRYSMPFFVHPYSACDLTVMDRFISEDRPAKWPPITAGEFLTQRLNEIGLLKK